MIHDERRLRELLGKPELARVVRRIRERLERGEPLAGQIILRDASDAERDAMDRLLGRPPSRGSALTVNLESLGELLRRAMICDDLAEAVERLSGPVVNRRAVRARVEQAWADLFAEAMRFSDKPLWGEWLSALRTSGLLRRLADDDPAKGKRLLDACNLLASRLPADAVPLAELAAAVAGDSHALDVGAPLGTLGVRMAALVGRVERWDRSDERREAWAAAGVMCDELSAPVLVLNLPVEDSTPSGRAMRLHAESGEPYRVSVRQLLRGTVRVSTSLASASVFVCENPTVVAAAANRLGPRCPPLLCTDGQLKTAARLLLARLRDVGADLLYHGDFDWGGLHIANTVFSRFAARPWRFSTADYLATPGGRELDGDPVDACWDTALRGAMVEHGRAIHEEQILDVLLADLARSPEPLGIVGR